MGLFYTHGPLVYPPKFAPFQQHPTKEKIWSSDLSDSRSGKCKDACSSRVKRATARILLILAFETWRVPPAMSVLNEARVVQCSVVHMCKYRHQPWLSAHAG